MKTNISIIAPARNEERNLEEYIRDINKLFKRERYAGEVILIDDRSTDSTYRKAKELSKKYPFVKVYRNKVRGGITGCWLHGLEHAKHDIIHLSTADMESHPSEDVPKLIPPLLEGFDVVSAVKDADKRNLGKVFLSSFFSIGLRMFFGVSGPGWVKAVKKDVFKKIPPLQKNWHRYLIPMAKERGLKIKEVETVYYPRKKGKSNFGMFGLSRGIEAFSDLIKVKAACARYRNRF